MKSIVPILLLAAGMPGFIAASASTDSSLVPGNWSCVSNCHDEEIRFSIEDNGTQRYDAWLHARPAASDGRWQLDGNHLTVECCAGLRHEWTILEISETEMILREEGQAGEMILRRQD